MEDDDEFGDLYTDVLTPFTISSAPHTAPATLNGSIDVQNLNKESPFEAPRLNQITLGFDPKSSDSKWPARDLESDGDVKQQDSQKRDFEYPNLIDESEINVVVDDRLVLGRSENFDVEEVDTGIGNSVIPGLSIPGVSEPANNGKDVDFGDGDDWDSDSDDDLQIVLNDNNHGPMAMDRAGLVAPDDDDADEDGDPLVIVADSDPNHQPIEDQEWGEDATAAQGGDGKELGDGSTKVNGVVQPMKTTYGYHHQFHSQFKYVRPGAAPMPGAAPVNSGGPPGQIRPPVNMGPTPGRGRGDWRPAGMKNAPPMQKGFHAGYGMPVWGNNTSGHGFGRGLEFTLPSHKTIFEVDIDSFEEKPWRLPGIDISDFFNFGLNEETWKDYCKQLEQLRLEATMQSKIRVYESGRTEQEYDPDMPPELAAAAGIHDVSSDNANLGKADVGQSDLAKGSMHARPQLPTGRAIQVETGYGERLPSIDTRPPRIRDSDAIIEIVLQDSADDDSFQGNDITELQDNDTSREDLRRSHDIEENNAVEGTKLLDSVPQTYNDRKRELVGRKAPLKNSAHDSMTEDGNSLFESEAPILYHSDSRDRTPVYSGRNSHGSRDERLTKGKVHDRSPSITRSGSTQDKRFPDNQKDESVESIDDKRSPPFSSRLTAGTTEEQDFDHCKDAMHDELLKPDGRSDIDREAIDLNMADTLEDENLVHSMRKQKLGSQVEQPSLEEIDDGEDSKAAKSSENSKAISGSSRDYGNLRDGTEEEVVQDGRSIRMGIIKRPLNEDEHSSRSKGREEREGMDRHRMAMKGREDSYHRKNWDSNSAHHSHMKTESIDRRKESDVSDGAWQRKDEDPHGRRTRAEDTRKKDRGDEMGSRHRSKVREIERSDIDEYQLRKQLDNGSWRGHHDKEMGLRHRERDDNLKTRIENLDDLHGKRRKEEAHLKRDHGEKEELLHVHRENSSRRKRERDDIMEQRKRDDIARLRNDDQQHSIRHKEEGWFQRERVVDRQRERERDDWQRLKQSHEETLSKREREDARGGVKSGRAAEEKAWASHSRAKDELKGSDREYLLKDLGRHSEQLKKRERVENESFSRHRGSEDVYSRGNQLNNDERRSRQERANTRSDRVVNASDNHRMSEKKHKENTRKSKESEGDNNSLLPSRRNQEDHSGQISERVCYLSGHNNISL